MSVRIPVVMPAKAGIQFFLLDSRQKHAGITCSISITSLCGAVPRNYTREGSKASFSRGDAEDAEFYTKGFSPRSPRLCVREKRQLLKLNKYISRPAHIVTPAEAGVQNPTEILNSGIRRNDD